MITFIKWFFADKNRTFVISFLTVMLVASITLDIKRDGEVSWYFLIPLTLSLVIITDSVLQFKNLKGK